MIKKWLEIITDHRISLRERMFRIVSGTCMVALVFILPMGRNIWNILILAVSLAVMGVIVNISIRKKKIRTGATAIAVLLLGLTLVLNGAARLAGRRLGRRQRRKKHPAALTRRQGGPHG